MKKNNLIALVIFVLAMVWIFTLKDDDVRSIQSKVLGLFGLVYESFDEITYNNDVVNGEPISVSEISKKYNKDELGVRYNKLLSDLYELRAWKSQIDLLREENIELKRSLNFVEFKRKQSQQLVAARVINRPSSTWWKTFVIDRGSDDGVRLNDPVMTPVAVDRAENVEGALVGKIVNVGKSQSTVVLVTDSECKIGAYVHGVFANANEKGLERVQGILSGAPGAGRDVSYLLLQNLPKEADRFGVSAGAKVYSSGVGNAEVSGIFPPGLILGYIKEFEVQDFDAVARVQPAINFNQLSYIFVLVSDKDSDLSSNNNKYDKASKENSVVTQ
ncbi:MAG: rod shape-determining protein MreC [Verrucomicrobiales bacterium]|mgnify:FL=1|jgi:rod shape-determining protein MreC|nr:rod shape-determining protein MreC [Verrucomicrobiales bacterium]|tara:strand:- start:550 stop:1542 length:993 start_codon:yes stop_codon:yes gene_type:complete